MPLVAKGPKKLGTAEEEQNGKAKAQEVENEEKDESFVLVSNIPSSWHTHHLRWDQQIFQSYFCSKVHLCTSGDTSVAGLRMRASAHSTSDTGQKKASPIQHWTILIQGRHCQNGTICRERRCSGGEGSGRGAEPEDRPDAEVQWGDLYKSPPTRWVFTFSNFLRDLR